MFGQLKEWIKRKIEGKRGGASRSLETGPSAPQAPLVGSEELIGRMAKGLELEGLGALGQGRGKK